MTPPLRTLAASLVLAVLAAAATPCLPARGEPTATPHHALAPADHDARELSLIATCPCSCSRGRPTAHTGHLPVFAPPGSPDEPAPPSGSRSLPVAGLQRPADFATADEPIPI